MHGHRRATSLARADDEIRRFEFFAECAKARRIMLPVGVHGDDGLDARIETEAVHETRYQRRTLAAIRGMMKHVVRATRDRGGRGPVA